MTLPRGRKRPTMQDLRDAGIEMRLRRMNVELNATFGATRRGRVLLRVARWIGRRRRA